VRLAALTCFRSACVHTGLEEERISR
jgi:hypothetical protein